MKQTWLVLMLIVGWAVYVSAPAAQAQTLKIAVEGKNPPFSQLDSKGQPYGFDVDIAKALCERMTLKCSFVVQPWELMIPGLLDGRHDAVISSMSITPERLEEVDFTNPYYSNRLRFIAREGAYVDPDQVPGLVIGAQRGTVAAKYLIENMARIVEIRLYDTNEPALKDLVDGTINAVLADGLFAYNWISTDQGKGFALAGKEIDAGDKIGIAVRKQDEALRLTLNTALEAILADGTYRKINEKYFPFNIY